MANTSQFELPDDYPVIERHAVRVIVRDSHGRILLFRTRDVAEPEQGEWWELSGGGLDGDETHVQAAVRELREETGLVITEADVAPPNWRRTATFRYRRGRRLQHEQIVLVNLGRPGGAIETAGRLDYELEDYVDFRWFPVAEVIGSQERFYPGRLPMLLGRVLSGEAIDEPFELWS